MHFDEEMGFQFLGPRSTVLSPSDPRPPTVPKDLPLLGPLGKLLGMPLGEPLEKPLGGPGFRGGQSEGDMSLLLKAPLSAPLPLW